MALDAATCAHATDQHGLLHQLDYSEMRQVSVTGWTCYIGFCETTKRSSCRAVFNLRVGVLLAKKGARALVLSVHFVILLHDFWL